MFEKALVNKPLSHIVYHYSDAKHQMVGAVWQSDKGGPWSAHCSYSMELYGHLGDFDNEQDAEACLKRRAMGDKNAKGRDSD